MGAWRRPGQGLQAGLPPRSRGRAGALSEPGSSLGLLLWGGMPSDEAFLQMKATPIGNPRVTSLLVTEEGRVPRALGLAQGDSQSGERMGQEK